MTQKEHAARIFNATVRNITAADNMEQAQSIAQLTTGFLVGIRLLGIVDAKQYQAMDRLLDAALDAVKRRMKKATPGAENTERGSKGGCPNQDNDSLAHDFSIAARCLNVKRDKERRVVK